MTPSAATTSMVSEAQRVLVALGLPVEQTNERAALTLLALLELRPGREWGEAGDPLLGTLAIMEYVARHFGKVRKPNTRETVRRFTLHQFVQAGLVVPNPDKPDRPTNSPHFCYQIAPRALALLRTWGTSAWAQSLPTYLAEAGSLRDAYARRRVREMIPLALPNGEVATLTPGGQNPLVHAILTTFCPHFTPGAYPIYIGDTGRKWLWFDDARLAQLGVTVESHGKMPDVVVHDVARNWLVLVEAVTESRPDQSLTPP